MSDFTTALLHEIELRKNYLSGEEINTIYFGGGTPSLLPLADLQKGLEKLRESFSISPAAEVTLEANPDDITAEKLQAWAQLGINRLSIGVQSFFDDDLQWMNRAHSANEAENCIRLAKAHGFNNLTIDLIYGTPTLSDNQWRYNVEKAISLGIPHLSCYALTVEAKTALHKMIGQRKLPDVDAEKQARHFELLMQWMEERGFEHYEISNFARPGWQSKHNSSYWQAEKYLGLGPSAHSFNGSSRQWNIANNSLYITALLQSKLDHEIEILSPQQQLNEYIMTGLRTMKGIDLQKIRRQFGETVINRLMGDAQLYLQNGQLTEEGNYFKLTSRGKLLADGIAADLFQL